MIAVVSQNLVAFGCISLEATRFWNWSSIMAPVAGRVTCHRPLGPFMPGTRHWLRESETTCGHVEYLLDRDVRSLSCRARCGPLFCQSFGRSDRAAHRQGRL